MKKELTRRDRDPEATRQALLKAATDLFAERGFDGTSVELIARKAGVNKAMVSYHFGGKRKLYVAILSSALLEMGTGLGSLEQSEEPAENRLGRFVGAFAAMAEAHPAVPHIVLREILAGGPHVDEDLLPHFLRVFSVVRGIVEGGIREGTFREVHPFLTHLTVVGSLLFFFVSAPVRTRLAAAGRVPWPMPPTAEFVEHLQEILVRGLAPSDDPQEGR